MKSLYDLLSEKSIIFHTFQNYTIVCFVALHPKSTANVMTGRSVHLTTLFSGYA